MEEDISLWQEFTRRVKPLKNNKKMAAAQMPPPVIQKKPGLLHKIRINYLQRLKHGDEKPIRELPKDLPYLETGSMERVDAKLAKKLKDGKYPIDEIIDLHGQTQEEAFDSLRYLIPLAQSAGKRCLLVITGKGYHTEGVLKSNLPRWLNLPGLAEYILAFIPARPKDGGGGAFYVLLRRK